MGSFFYLCISKLVKGQGRIKNPVLLKQFTSFTNFTLPALIMCHLQPVAITPLPDNVFPNKLAPNVHNVIPRNPLLCYFATFSIASIATFINKSESSRALIIFISSAGFELT